MAELFGLLVPVLLLAFSAWMFLAMLRNDDLPACFITITRGSDPRLDWAVAFVFLSIFTALYYYVNVFRHQQ